MSPEIKSNNIEIEPTEAMTVKELETGLYDTQEELKIAKVTSGAEDSRYLSQLVERQNLLIDLISIKAVEIKKDESNPDVYVGVLDGITKDYNQIISEVGDVEGKDIKIKEKVGTYIDSLKDRARLFIEDIKPENSEEEGEPFDQAIFEKMLLMMDGCIGVDQEKFISKLGEALRPMAEFQVNNPKLAERARRKLFLRSSSDKEQFYPIRGTDSILSYGIGGRNGDSLHLHLAPMRTVEDKHNFMYVVMMKAFEDVAEVVKANNQVKVITATSYLVAARPTYYKKFGFELEALSTTERGHSWGAEERPVLRAFMDREKFIKLFEKKDNL